MAGTSAAAVLQRAAELRSTLHSQFRDETVKSIYAEAERIAGRASHQTGHARYDFDQRIDRIVTSPIFGLPIMALMLAVVFWLTVAGANVPSAMLASAFFWFEDQAAALFTTLGAPWWLTGFLWHGVFRGLAWVVSVMLPPMMIFFPLFTMLEDLGYLPRVAFNLDFLFKSAGAHGKQALTMAMGFGCNAAGIIATRVIDSPRERLVAILTNNFVPCNGRYPTLILLATLFVGPLVPAGIASLAAAGTVVGVVIIGVMFTLAVSWALSKTVLKGEASAFTLELPPYRRPGILRILYTSHAVRAVARDAHGGPGRRGDLAPGQHHLRRCQLRPSYRQRPESPWARDRARWRDPSRLHHRNPGQRDRRADVADGVPRHGDDDRRRVVG
jgi:ferrous iron transport protein B